jgi:hypothetical protein
MKPNMKSLHVSELASWPEASRKRRILAWYLDFLIIGAPWALVVWGLAAAVPVIQTYSLPMQAVLVLAINSMLLRGASWSPGHWLLGIHKVMIKPPGDGDTSSQREPIFIVEPCLKSGERWWTILFGVFSILNGAKSLVRWTFWAPTMPVMGVQPSEGAAIVVCLIFGVLECALGCATLRLRPAILIVGPIFYGATLVSLLLSWSLLTAWAERYVIARLEYQGRPGQEDQVEFMQTIMPIGLVAGGAIAGIWMVLVLMRVRRARAEISGI